MGRHMVGLRIAATAGLVLLGGCGAPADSADAGMDVDASDAAPPHACPFDLSEAECRALEEASDCAWAMPCSEPTIPRAGCLQATACVEDGDCEVGLECQQVSLQSEGLDMCLQVTLCVPPG